MTQTEMCSPNSQRANEQMNERASESDYAHNQTAFVKQVSACCVFPATHSNTMKSHNRKKQSFFYFYKSIFSFCFPFSFIFRVWTRCDFVRTHIARTMTFMIFSFYSIVVSVFVSTRTTVAKKNKIYKQTFFCDDCKNSGLHTFIVFCCLDIMN